MMAEARDARQKAAREKAAQDAEEAPGSPG